MSEEVSIASVWENPPKEIGEIELTSTYGPISESEDTYTVDMSSVLKGVESGDKVGIDLIISGRRVYGFQRPRGIYEQWAEISDDQFMNTKTGELGGFMDMLFPSQVEWLWKNGDIENRMQKVISSKCRRDIDLDKKLSVLRRNGSTVREMFQKLRGGINE